MTDVARTESERLTAPALEDRSIRFLKEKFAKEYGEKWAKYEIESLVDDLPAEAVTPLLIAKLRLLKTIEYDQGERFYRDPMFMLACIDIMNGNLPDADVSSLPSVTSLELAFGLTLATEMYPPVETNTMKALTKIILSGEGYNFVPKEFEGLISQEDLGEDISKEDSKNKQKAISAYLRLMEMVDRAKNV